MNTKSIQMSATHGWEIPYPVSWIFEVFNFLLGNVHHSQQVVLEFSWLYVLWELWWIAVCFQLVCQLYGSRANWHSSAMESEGEQYIVSI